ncbi:hypothetical protein Tco_0061130, partial [Tanacetum coccineum]
LEAELDQSVVDRKHDEIERKNLLIEVFYVASNSELNISRFIEMQKAHNVVNARCLEIEAELSKLRDNIHKDNYNELLNWFSNLEVNHLNLQLKYQNLKDSFQNKPSPSVNDTPDFNSDKVNKEGCFLFTIYHSLPLKKKWLAVISDYNPLFKIRKARRQQDGCS